MLKIIVTLLCGSFLIGTASAKKQKFGEKMNFVGEVVYVKQAGGLNNDWELTYHVLSLLMAKIETPRENPHSERWACHENLMPGCDAKALSAYLKSSATPLADLDKQHSNKTNSWIEYLSTGDVGAGNIIKQIFQELYLGGELFRQTYGFAPRIHDRKGLIDREALLIPASTIKRQAKTHRLALATGRPRAEAEHALSRFELQAYFKMTYTLDECLAEEKRIYEKSGDVLHLSKPHPFMLDAVVEHSSAMFGNLYYIGDMPDDMQAAANSAYDYTGVGILHSSPHKQSLKKGLIRAGADVIIRDVDELLAYFN